MNSSQKKLKTNSGEGQAVPKSGINFQDLMPTEQKANKFGNNVNSGFKNQDHSNKKDWKSNNNATPYNNSKFNQSKPYNNSGQDNSYGNKGNFQNKNNYGNNQGSGYNSNNNNSYLNKRNNTNNYNQDNGEAAPHWHAEKAEKSELYNLAAKMSRKENTAEEKVDAVQNSLNFIGNDLSKYVVKKSGSKLVQSCLKRGSKDQREQIYKDFMKCNLEDVLKNTYGKFLIKKIVLYVHNKTLLSSLNSWMIKNFFKLIFNETSVRAT